MVHEIKLRREYFFVVQIAYNKRTYLHSKLANDTPELDLAYKSQKNW